MAALSRRVDYFLKLNAFNPIRDGNGTRLRVAKVTANPRMGSVRCGRDFSAKYFVKTMAGSNCCLLL